MSLKHSYTLLAPFYDYFVSKPLDKARRKSIARINNTTNKKILINGIGSGLDIPYLSRDAEYTGSDITPAMLNIAHHRAAKLSFNIDLICADSQNLPFNNEQFDIVIMHLILAVVPDSNLALQEAARVLKPGGSLFIFDKFLKPDEFAPFRKIFNLFIRHIATRTDVVFEHTLESSPSLKVISNEPALANGWFRLIELKKTQYSTQDK